MLASDTLAITSEKIITLLNIVSLSRGWELELSGQVWRWADQPTTTRNKSEFRSLFRVVEHKTPSDIIGTIDYLGDLSIIHHDMTAYSIRGCK